MAQEAGLMALEDHRLLAAKQIASPNHNERPSGEEISLIVVHCISLPPGEFEPETVEAFFCNRLEACAHPYFAGIAQMQVSSHLYIERGGQVTQFVPFDRRAWHAGQSCYQDRSACNDFSIGIELAGAEDVPYTPAQYGALVAVIRTLHQHYPATQAHPVVGHSDIAPGRKTDPGPAFDWQALRVEGINTI